MSDEFDPFGGNESVPAVSFKGLPEGEKVVMDVLSVDTDVQGLDFDTRQPAVWKGTQDPKLSIVVKVKLDGEERSLWVTKYAKDPLYAALKDAQTEAGATIKAGGKLAVWKSGSRPARGGAHLNPQILYGAQYKAPQVDAFADATPAAPATAAAPF